MFFTKLGHSAAGLIFFWGFVQIAMGFAVATGVLIEPEPGRYLAGTSGEAIEGGFYYVFIAIILGVITEISRAVFKGDS